MTHENKANTAYKQQYETVDQPERIFSLLKPLLGKESSIKLHLADTHHVYTSTLLLIDIDRQIIRLSKLNSVVAHRAFLKSKLIHLHGQVHGADLSFTCKLKRYISSPNAVYDLQVPEKIKYCQRRMNHRVHVSLSMDVTATFINDNGQKYEGHLRDLSADGMRVQLLKVNPNEFPERKLIPNCVISFPDHTDVECTFEIKHKHTHVRNRGCTVGGTFYGISAIQKRMIERFIASVERKSLREMRV